MSPRSKAGKILGLTSACVWRNSYRFRSSSCVFSSQSCCCSSSDESMARRLSTWTIAFSNFCFKAVAWHDVGCTINKGCEIQCQVLLCDISNKIKKYNCRDLNFHQASMLDVIRTRNNIQCRKSGRKNYPTYGRPRR